jgi:hypothetical protein
VSRRQVMNCYTIFKQTNTHADSLAAVGAADLLRHLDPRIVDLGDRFEVRLRIPGQGERDSGVNAKTIPG